MFHKKSDKTIFSPCRFLSVIFRHLLFVTEQLFYGVKGFVAYNVLDFAGVICCRFGGNAYRLKKLRQHHVALICFVCNFFALIGQKQIAVFIGVEVSALL